MSRLLLAGTSNTVQQAGKPGVGNLIVDGSPVSFTVEQTMPLEKTKVFGCLMRRQVAEFGNFVNRKLALH